MKRLMAVAMCLIALGVAAQNNPCGGIRDAKEKTYNFRPAQVDDKTREAKSKEMDAFWKLVKQSGPAGVRCLRDMLAAQKQSEFFLFDGASLLFSLDESSASLKVVSEALGRADMNDIEPGGYLSLLIQLAKKDVDIGPLAAKYLYYSEVTTAVPQHAMTFDRAMGAILLYGSMPAADVDKYLVPALQDTNPDVRSAAALALAINMTEESFRALKAFPQRAQLPPDIKKEVDAYTKYTPVPSGTPKFTREQVLKALRRIPHSREEFEAVSAEEFKVREKYEAEHPIKEADTAAYMARREAFNNEFGPYTSLSGHTTFVRSAVLTLTEADLPLVREERRKQVRMSDEAFYELAAYTRIIEGVINRLDLYKEYRTH